MNMKMMELKYDYDRYQEIVIVIGVVYSTVQ